MVLLGCVQVSAQSLQILPAPPGSADGSGSFHIMMVAPDGKAPAALEWSLSPIEGVRIGNTEIKAAAAVIQLQKTLTCAPPPEKTTATAYVCIIAGGREPIPNGPIAAVRFTAAEGTGAVTIHLHGILGATPDAQPVSFTPLEATLPVKRTVPTNRH
jgi:hypothetical protein